MHHRTESNHENAGIPVMDLPRIKAATRQYRIDSDGRIPTVNVLQQVSQNSDQASHSHESPHT